MLKHNINLLADLIEIPKKAHRKTDFNRKLFEYLWGITLLMPVVTYLLLPSDIHIGTNTYTNQNITAERPSKDLLSPKESIMQSVEIAGGICFMSFVAIFYACNSQSPYAPVKMNFDLLRELRHGKEASLEEKRLIERIIRRCYPLETDDTHIFETDGTHNFPKKFFTAFIEPEILMLEKNQENCPQDRLNNVNPVFRV